MLLVSEKQSLRPGHGTERKKKARAELAAALYNVTEVRVDRKVQLVDPTIREAINDQQMFQLLESRANLLAARTRRSRSVHVHSFPK